jgi:hypothetical protein
MDTNIFALLLKINIIPNKMIKTIPKKSDAAQAVFDLSLLFKTQLGHKANPLQTDSGEGYRSKEFWLTLNQRSCSIL